MNCIVMKSRDCIDTYVRVTVLRVLSNPFKDTDLRIKEVRMLSLYQVSPTLLPTYQAKATIHKILNSACIIT